MNSGGLVTIFQLAVPQQLALLETATNLLAVDLSTLVADGNEAGLAFALAPAADVYGEDHLLSRAREIAGLAKTDPGEAAASKQRLVREFVSLVEQSSAPNPPPHQLIYLKRVLGLMEKTTRVVRMGIDVANAIALNNQLENVFRTLQERGIPVDIFIIDRDREVTVRSKLIHIEGDPSGTQRRMIVEAKVIKGSMEGERDSYSVIFSDRTHPLPMELSKDEELGNLSFNITLFIDELLL